MVSCIRCFHWRELPQVYFLSQQKYCRDKHLFCRDKGMLAATIFFCRDTTFLVINICRDKTFLTTSILLSRQKTCFVMTNMFVTTKQSLLRQNFCRDQILFVATKICLSRQIFCCDKNTCGSSRQWFVAVFFLLFVSSLPVYALHTTCLSLAYCSRC